MRRSCFVSSPARFGPFWVSLPPKHTEHTNDTKETLPSRVLGLHVLWPRLSVR
jgi:hypothetical protein